MTGGHDQRQSKGAGICPNLGSTSGQLNWCQGRTAIALRFTIACYKRSFASKEFQPFLLVVAKHFRMCLLPRETHSEDSRLPKCIMKLPYASCCVTEISSIGAATILQRCNSGPKKNVAHMHAQISTQVRSQTPPLSFRVPRKMRLEY